MRSACRKHVAFPTPLRITLELEGKTGTPASVQVMRPDDETSVGECAARTLRTAVRPPAFSQARLAVTWRIDVSS